LSKINIDTLLKTELFSSLFDRDTIKLTELDAILRLLVKAEIPFDLTYSPGTKRTAAALELTVYINPTTTLNFIITLQAGGSVFGAN